MPASDYVPDQADVAIQITSRTRDAYGNLLGVFSEATTPSDTQVQSVIAKIITEVADAIGDDIPEALWDDASEVVAKRAAMQIELDFFSNQVSTGRSVYPQLKEQYDGALVNLQRQITVFEEGGSAVLDSSASLSPSYSFPDAAKWLDRLM